MGIESLLEGKKKDNSKIVAVRLDMNLVNKIASIKAETGKSTKEIYTALLHAGIEAFQVAADRSKKNRVMLRKAAPKKATAKKAASKKYTVKKGSSKPSTSESATRKGR